MSDGIGEYYARIEKRKRAAWEQVHRLDRYITAGLLDEALVIVKEHVGDRVWQRDYARLDRTAALARARHQFRELAHDAGNTGD